LIDGLWKAKVWFDKPGWQNIQIDGHASDIPVYVSSVTEWNSLSAANTIRRTQRSAFPPLFWCALAAAESLKEYPSDFFPDR
jgi:hypothetical protein